MSFGGKIGPDPNTINANVLKTSINSEEGGTQRLTLLTPWETIALRKLQEPPNTPSSPGGNFEVDTLSCNRSERSNVGLVEKGPLLSSISQNPR